MHPDVGEIFSKDGLFASEIGGFSYRQQQQAMAQSVSAAINDNDVLVAEAGTGTGKTFAYLVPALLSGGKIIVSTGTRNLQDQLFHRDLPVVMRAMSIPADVCLLKGRANYLCVHRLQNLQFEADTLSRQMSQWLEIIEDWSQQTHSGDINELGVIPEDASIWPQVTSNTDNCLGGECPVYRDCHLVEARRRAQEADLVVINHHLLCSDLALKEEGFGELLPAADCFIIDEAHQLPETATHFFGSNVSSRQIMDFLRDAELAYRQEANDQPELLELLDAVKKSTRDFRLSFGLGSQRDSWNAVREDEVVIKSLQQLQSRLQQSAEMLDDMAARGKGLQSASERNRYLSLCLEQFLQADEGKHIRWFETGSQSLRLQLTPLDISEPFQEQMQQLRASWIFTSATLAVGDDFKHYCQRLGLQDVRQGKWDSPFDYEQQAMLYMPDYLPEPFDEHYPAKFAQLASHLIDLSAGRCFVLFTSHRALQDMAERFEDRLDYPLFIQGTAPKAELVADFTECGRGVLLGTASFWEGVDVKGAALSLVIIDKLPFASPGDPVLQARLAAMKAAGENPFISYQLPQAILALKQGAGRLIRDASDRGALVICDPRLYQKPYGKLFLKSLPPMKKTHMFPEISHFLKHELQTEAAEA
ncbi:MAG: ATP-dependent DNA helicase [gamma proteobacterium symbiont of Bathyaustriella thionipta]|nr:ATP-dependent DNA helicase [gamma proteobacterium symbiont of Bathyaustriella thionipta]